MILSTDLRKVARLRLTDAAALFKAKRYDGTFYRCGYTVEIALKCRICKTLRWPDWPQSSKEFQNLRSFRTHSLDILLKLSGVEQKIKSNYFTEWSIVTEWDPDARYKVKEATRASAESMLQSARTLLTVL